MESRAVAASGPGRTAAARGPCVEACPASARAFAMDAGSSRPPRGPSRGMQCLPAAALWSAPRRSAQSRDDRRHAPLAFAEEERVRHAVARFGHQRVGRRGVGAAENDGRPLLPARAATTSAPRSVRSRNGRFTCSRSHELETSTRSNVDPGAVRLRSQDQRKAGLREQRGVGGPRQECHVDERARQRSPYLAGKGRGAVWISARRRRATGAGSARAPAASSHAGLPKVGLGRYRR